METHHDAIDFSTLIPTERIERMVQFWFDNDNDTPSSLHINRMIVGINTRKASLCLKSSGIIAGKPFVDVIFNKLNCKILWNKEIQEGIYMNRTTNKDIPIATITGPTHQLLKGERIALNILSRCSGIATETYNIINIAKNEYNWNGYIAGCESTEDTISGFRLIEQYGLLVGGASIHHHDPNQMTIIKSNHHINQMNNYNNQKQKYIQNAIQYAKRIIGFTQKIEVECISYDYGIIAAEAGADIIMLDDNNYPTPESLINDVIKLKEIYPNILIEVCYNNNNTNNNVAAIDNNINMIHYFSEYIDIISLGKLTQGYSCLDYILNVSTASVLRKKEQQQQPQQQEQEQEITNDESDDDRSINRRKRGIGEVSTISTSNNNNINNVPEVHALVRSDRRHQCTYCAVMGKKPSRRTRYKCRVCNLPLCSIGNGKVQFDCFAIAHSNNDIHMACIEKHQAMQITTTKKGK